MSVNKDNEVMRYVSINLTIHELGSSCLGEPLFAKFIELTRSLRPKIPSFNFTHCPLVSPVKTKFSLVFLDNITLRMQSTAQQQTV
jgi:hypothetical protein